MSVEARRGCGFRKVGGIYLVCDGEGMPCGKLPLPLHSCPVCGAGIKQSRGWTWIKPNELFPDASCNAAMCGGCPLASIETLETAGLLWVGKSFYKTPRHFDIESKNQGICRRISAIPRDFKLGETWVFLAHPETIPGENDDGDQVMLPGVFKVFRPSAIEQLVTESQAKDEDFMEGLRKRGITPVAVPDDDPDHQGTVWDKTGEEE